MTDNKNRTVGEIRHMLAKYNGNLGAENSVAWMFSKKGYMVIEKAGVDEEKLLNAVLEAGADDLRDDGDSFEVITEPGVFEAVKEAVKALSIEPVTAKVSMLPQNYIKLEGKEATADAPPDGGRRGPRRRAERVVQLRHRGEGDRGLAGVRVFGIDPGSDRTGYGCVETDGRRHRLVVCGAIATAGAADFAARLALIHDGLAAQLRDCRPDAVAIENLFHAVNVRSALKLGHARGVAMLAAVEAGVPVRRVLARRRSSARSSATAAPRRRKCSR